MKTISHLKESNGFRKTPEVLTKQKLTGGMSDKEDSDTIGGFGLIRIPVTRGVFLELSIGKMDTYVLHDCPYWRSRLFTKSGGVTKKKIIQFYHVQKDQSQLKITVEFKGLTTVGYAYRVFQGEYSRQLNVGDFVLKLGNILKFEDKL